MRVTRGFTLLEIDKITQNTIVAPGGMEFYIDDTWDPYHHIKIEQKVMDTAATGPSFNRLGYRKCPQIEADFSAGDTVYVQWTWINADNIFIIGGKRVIRVPLASIFAKKTDDGFQAVGEWAVIEPAASDDTVDTSTLIIPEDFKNRVSDDIGTVVSVGSYVDPLIKPGKKVLIGRLQATPNPGHEDNDPDTLNALKIGNRREGESMAFTYYIQGKPYWVQFANSFMYEPMDLRGNVLPAQCLNEVVMVLD